MTLSKSVRGFVLMLMAMGISTVSGFGIKVFLARSLGPEALGAFALCYALLYVTGTLADLGVRQGLVSLVSRSQEPDGPEAVRLWSCACLIKTAAGLVATVAGLLLAEPVARLVFHKPPLAPYFCAVAVGFSVWSAWDLLEGALQIRLRFGFAASLRATIDGLRLVSLYVMWALHLQDMRAYMWLYVLTPLLLMPVALYIGRPHVSRAFLDRLPHEGATLWRFSRLVFLYRLFALVLTVLDSFTLGRFHDLDALGYYEAAKGIAYIVLLANEAMNFVLLPRVTAFADPGEYRRFLVRFAWCFAGAAAFAPVVLFVAPWILAVFGRSFGEPRMLGIVKILVPGCLCVLPLSMVSMVMMSLRKPEIPARVSVVQVLAAAVAYGLVVPRWGPEGAAWVNTGSQALGMTIGLLLLRREMGRLLQRPAAASGIAGASADASEDAGREEGTLSGVAG